MMDSTKTIRLRAGGERRIAKGHPWIYANEIEMDKVKDLPPGGLVQVLRQDGESMGSAFFNPHSLIAARLVSDRALDKVDKNFFLQRLQSALSLREKLFAEPFYRLVHAEADYLPGLIIDRYGEHFVLQINNAGIDHAQDSLLAAMEELFQPRTLFIDKESPVRNLEGLERTAFFAKGQLSDPIPVKENGTLYFALLGQGQKTGWFFDQRENRALIRKLAKGRNVLDGYSYSGGFAIQAALGGAQSVLALDRSEAALRLGEKAAQENGLGQVAFEKTDIFAFLEQSRLKGRRFGLTLMDPPAFVKSRKDLQAGRKGYRKLARAAAFVTEESGFLFLASCSHPVGWDDFRLEIAAGIRDAGRKARILGQYGAAPDHPVHPFLPESAYLKGILLALD